MVFSIKKFLFPVSLLIYNKNGEVTGAVFGSSDITQRKKAELQLEKSNKALRDLKIALDVSNIVSFTDANGYFTYVNRHFERVTVKNPVFWNQASMIRNFTITCGLRLPREEYGEVKLKTRPKPINIFG